MSDALIATSYAEIASLHRHFRLLHGSPEALEYLLVSTPTPTGAQLESWLAVAQNRAAFEQLISAPAGMAAVAASSTAMAAVVASSTAVAAVVASSTAMAAVAASSTAMAAVVASSTAMAAVAASSTAMAAVAASSTAMAAVVASSTAMAAVAASSTAMAAVVASSTAMAAVVASSTAMEALNASDTALNALYASPLVVKYTHAGGGWSANPQMLRNGAGLFVRLTQLDNSSGWYDNFTSSHYLRFDGSNTTIASTNNGLPYNFTQVNAKFGRQPARYFSSQFGFYDYNRIELAYIPL